MFDSEEELNRRVDLSADRLVRRYLAGAITDKEIVGRAAAEITPRDDLIQACIIVASKLALDLHGRSQDQMANAFTNVHLYLSHKTDAEILEMMRAPAECD